MRRLLLSLWVPACIAGLRVVLAPAQVTQPASPTATLTTVAQIRALSRSEVSQGRPVELHGTLTYYEPAEGQIFIQDATGAIFVIAPPKAPDLQPGDQVVVRGITASSFDGNVKASSIELAGHGTFPAAVPEDWQRLVDPAIDCRYVSIKATVRAATLQYAAAGRNRPGSGENGGAPYLLLDVQMDGGSVRVHLENPGNIDPIRLLDAKVRLSGAVGGIFDGIFQQTGVELWLSGADHMQVLEPGRADVTSLPLTDISRIMSHSYVLDESRRVHVRGSVTLYQPGLQVVVETPDRSAVQVQTYEQSPLRIGQVVDVVGFPFLHEYAEQISQANVLPTPQMRPIEPVAIEWHDAIAGHYPFELVSMEGRVAAEVHERHQDTLVIQAGSHVFSAILSRTVWSEAYDQQILPRYAIGSRVRVTGVCYVHAGGPWTTQQWFDVEMRTPDDVVVLASPPWLTVRHLITLIAALLVIAISAILWVMFLQRKVRQQTEQIRMTMESEAARERRVAQVEAERARVLEAINSVCSLEEVLGLILGLIRSQLQCRACWCELANGNRVGDPAPDESILLVRRDIFSGTGGRLGALVLAGGDVYHIHAGEVMEIGASLAALAIDTRRLYETLMHRSQYDQLTNAANRFLLETRLEETLALAERNKTQFALVYIDLDQFKQVNDLYGHRVGDLLLQQVTQRISERLRTMDTLARVGGDEFIALVQVVHSRAQAEEIVQRLMRAFDSPFEVESYSIPSGASVGMAVYPEDGLTIDELQRVADSAMYAHKPHVAD